MSKRTRGSLVATVAVAMIVAACSGTAATPTTPPATTGPNPSGQTTQPPTQSLAGVNLTLWVPASSQKTVQPVMDAFTAATGATFSTTVIPSVYESNVPTQLATGVKPDLLLWQPSTSTLPLIQPANNLQPLDSEPFVANLADSVKNVGVLDGVRYAAPIQVPSVVGVYYNKDLFTKAGITTLPTDWASMVAAGKQVASVAPGGCAFYEMGGDKWGLQFPVQIQMSDLGQTFWDNVNQNKAKWTDPRIVADIARYNDDIIKSGLAGKDYQTGTYAGQADAVFSGTCAMTVNLGILVGAMQTAGHSPQDIDAHVGWFPIGPSGPTAIYSTTAEGGLVTFKSGDAAREAGARQFINFWLGDYYPTYLASANQPSVLTTVPSPATVTKIAQDQLAALPNAVGQFQVLAVYAPDMYKYLADMLYGQKTPEQVAEATQQEFVQAAAAQGIPGF